MIMKMNRFFTLGVMMLFGFVTTLTAQNSTDKKNVVKIEESNKVEPTKIEDPNIARALKVLSGGKGDLKPVKFDEVIIIENGKNISVKQFMDSQKKGLYDNKKVKVYDNPRDIKRYTDDQKIKNVITVD
jgi:hypothetical protein